jgi:hypothetical protein
MSDSLPDDIARYPSSGSARIFRRIIEAGKL